MLPPKSLGREPSTRRPLRLAAGSMLDIDRVGLIEAAAAAGFDGVGLRLSGEHGAVDGHSDQVLRAVAGDKGVSITDVEVVRVDRLGKSVGADIIERAAVVGASHVLAVSDHPDRHPTATAMRALATRCDEAGVGLAIEYMAWTMPNGPADAIDLAIDVGAVVVIDVLHHHRLGFGPQDAAQVATAGVLGWVQLCDGPHGPSGPPFDREALIVEARGHRLMPGFGDLPLQHLLAALPDDCPVSIEVQSSGDASAGVARAISLFNAATAVLAATD